MSAANKARGSRWENDLESYLNECGLKARRLPRAGSKDVGDVVIELAAVDIVIEAKNVKSPDMAQFLREADVEASHYEAKYNRTALGVVVVKTRQKGTGSGRVTLELDTLIDLLRWNGLT